MKINDIRQYLREFDGRELNDPQAERCRFALKYHKKQAVREGYHELAKEIWILEQILLIQSTYLAAFRQLKDSAYYKAWCSLERIEIETGFLERHYDITDNTYWVHFISEHVRRFQRLYPYTLFVSPEILYIRKICTICNRPISIRNSCGHRTGEIYRGKMCSRIIRESRFLALAIVENPVQKYSVMFIRDESTGEQVDNYNYQVIEYVVKGLHHPFSAWETRETKRRYPHRLFADVDPNDNCPCGSQKQYKSCCLRKKGVARPHIVVEFSEPPPPDFPRHIFQYKATKA